MPASPESSIRARPIVGKANSFGGTAFLQQRLALFGKVVFLLSFGFFVIMNGMIAIGGKVPPGVLLTQQSNVFHLLSSSMMALLWMVASVRPWSPRVLGGLEAGSLVLAGVGLTLMAAHPAGDILTATFALAVTLLGRAILVPSSATRTFYLSALAGVPVLALALFMKQPHPPAVPFPPEFFEHVVSVNTALWLALVVGLSTVASHTIFSLRQEVREAREIGQYTLEEKIGGGGMGEVWRARHRLLIRPAAVKLIRHAALGAPAGHDPQLSMRRFEREARATASLKSPHTVQLYDFGVTDDGTLYYVMELLDGLDLDVLVERFGPVPAERAIHLLEQICASLEDAHQNGLVHRDIKPANVVVGRFGATSDFVKVLDFGLVKLESAQKAEDGIALTARGSISGTPGFMAPEVVVDETATDHRVDLYSLGCVAYWLVTGKLVFEGSSAMAVMVEHAKTQPPPPSTRSELPIPAELEALILQCLEKNPDDRPSSAAEVQARLQQIPIATSWTRERAEEWWTVHAPGVAASRPIADVLLSQEARPVTDSAALPSQRPRRSEKPARTG